MRIIDDRNIKIHKNVEKNRQFPKKEIIFSTIFIICIFNISNKI